MKVQKTQKGGARSGSGRPKIEGLKTRKITATDAEWEVMRQARDICRTFNLSKLNDGLNLKVSITVTSHGLSVSTHHVDGATVDHAPFELTRRPIVEHAPPHYQEIATGRMPIPKDEGKTMFQIFNTATPEQARKGIKGLGADALQENAKEKRKSIAKD